MSARGFFFVVKRIFPYDLPSLGSISSLESHESQSCPPLARQGMPVPDPGAFHYQRHRPEKTLLYQLGSKYLDFTRLC